jgi:hypothetical protein
LKVKLEGPESPNCHGDDQGDRDFHIWLANSADGERSDAVVVELTPRIRAKHPSWSRTNLNRLIATKPRVRVSGWVLLDPEHPDQVRKTRATIWEIHPIMMIEFFAAANGGDSSGSCFTRYGGAEGVKGAFCATARSRAVYKQAAECFLGEKYFRMFDPEGQELPLARPS